MHEDDKRCVKKVYSLGFDIWTIFNNADGSFFHGVGDHKSDIDRDISRYDTFNNQDLRENAMLTAPSEYVIGRCPFGFIRVKVGCVICSC